MLSTHNEQAAWQATSPPPPPLLQLQCLGRSMATHIQTWLDSHHLHNRQQHSPAIRNLLQIPNEHQDEQPSQQLAKPSPREHLPLPFQDSQTRGHFAVQPIVTKASTFLRDPHNTSLLLSPRHPSPLPVQSNSDQSQPSGSPAASSVPWMHLSHVLSSFIQRVPQDSLDTLQNNDPMPVSQLTLAAAWRSIPLAVMTNGVPAAASAPPLASVPLSPHSPPAADALQPLLYGSDAGAGALMSPLPGMHGAVSKEDLGRATWTLLHTLAAQLPERPSRQQQRDVRQFIQLFSRVYPCGDCSRHFQQIIKRDPPVVSSAREFQLWMCRVHNTVNRSIGKPVFNCELVTARWTPLDCSDKADASAPSACDMTLGRR